MLETEDISIASREIFKHWTEFADFAWHWHPGLDADWNTFVWKCLVSTGFALSKSYCFFKAVAHPTNHFHIPFWKAEGSA